MDSTAAFQGVYRTYKTHLFTRVAIAMILISTTGYLTIGWNGIKPILVDEGMFHAYCDKVEIVNGTKVIIKFPKNETCGKQRNYMNSIIQVNLSFGSIVMAFIGPLIDFFHKWKRIRIIYFVFVIGNFVSIVMFGFCVRFRFMDVPFYVSVIMFNTFGVSGASLFLLFMKVYQSTLPKILGKKKIGVVVNGLLCSAVSISPLVFYLFFVFYFYLKVDFMIIVAVYTGVSFSGFLGFGFFVPVPQGVEKKLKQLPGDDSQSSSTDSISSDDKEDVTLLKPEIQESFKLVKKLDARTVLKSIGIYLLITIYFSLTLFECNYFISTVYDQALWMTQSLETAKKFSSIYAILQPIISCLFSLVFTYIGRNLPACMIILTIFNAVWSSTACVKNIWVQIATYLFQNFENSIMIDYLFAFVRFYLGETYSATLVSIAFAIGGAISILTILMDYLVRVLFDDDFFYMNVIAGVIGFLSHIPIFVFSVVMILVQIREKIRKKKELAKLEEKINY